jgi:hypothetical protein
MSGERRAKPFSAPHRRATYGSVMRARLPIILLLALWIPAALAADIGISPPRLELVGAAGERLTATITVITSARTEQQVAAEIGDWTMDFRGEMAFFPRREPGAQRFGMARARRRRVRPER